MKTTNVSKIRRGFFKENFGWFLLSTILVIVLGFLRMLGVAFLDDLLTVVQEQQFQGLWWLILFACLSQMAFYILRWVVAELCRFLTEKLALTTRLAILRHLNRIPFIDFETLGVGNLQAIVRGDVSEAAQMIYIVFSRLLTNFFMAAFSLAYMFRIHVGSGLLTLAFSLLMGYINVKMGGPIRTHNTEVRKSIGEVSQQVLNLGQSRDTLALYRAEPFGDALYQEPRDRQNKASLRFVSLMIHRENIITVLTQLCIFASIFFVTLGSGNPKDSVILISLLMQVVTPVGIIFRWITSVVTSLSSWDRIQSIFDYSTEEHLPDEALPAKDSTVKTLAVAPFQFFYGRTEDQASPQEGLALNAPAMEFNQGNIYCITGESGSGKSTFLKVITGLYSLPSPVFTLNGVQRTPQELFGLSALVPPNPTTFYLSIYENLTMGEDISREECYAVLEELGLREWIDSLPEGLDYILQEGGKNVSGGQKQLLSLARALLSPHPMLVLDEPFSAVDQDKEILVIQSLERRKKEKLILYTSHRESSFAFADGQISLS